MTRNYPPTSPVNTNSPARAGAEEEMRMGTEDELRVELERAILRASHVYDPAERFLSEMRIPLPVLAWITANPEAAKGLASGEMVAVPCRIGPHHLQQAYAELERRGYRAMIDYLSGLAAVSPPAPRGKPQHLQRPDVNHPLRSHNPMEVDND